MRNQFLLIAGLLFFSLITFAQQTITGKITDKSGVPLAGVSVKVKGTTRGVSTNNAGEFSIQASANHVLEISTIGFKKQSVNLAGNSAITVSLESEITELGEVVFIGS